MNLILIICLVAVLLFITCRMGAMSKDDITDDFPPGIA